MKYIAGLKAMSSSRYKKMTEDQRYFYFHGKKKPEEKIQVPEKNSPVVASHDLKPRSKEDRANFNRLLSKLQAMNPLEENESPQVTIAKNLGDIGIKFQTNRSRRKDKCLYPKDKY